jgi:cytochrome c-type biogenesis protein CcsB
MNPINLSLVLYFAACVLYFLGEIFTRPKVGTVASATFAVGIISNLVAVIARWFQSGHPPLSNMHESLAFIAFFVALVSIVVVLKYKIKIVGAFSALAALMALGYASILDTTIQPLMPALKSNWLIIHVTTYFAAYGALVVATISAAGFLIINSSKSPHETLSRRLDTLSFRLILFAFPFLTIGLTTGAVWANVAWGRYWGWDPKETFSLVTWLIYALYLHLRTMRGWQGKRTAVVAVAGFFFIIFTFFGVNFLMGGLHSYR